MKNLNEKQMLILSVTVSTIVALGLLYGIYSNHNALGELHDEIIAVQEEDDNLQKNKVQKIEKISEELKGLRKKQDNELWTQLPGDGDREASSQQLMEDLQKFADETNVTALSVNHEYEKQDKNKRKKKKKGPVANYESIKYHYTFQAKFEDAVLFINRLENYDRILRVENLTIESGRGSGEGGSYGMKLSFSAFLFKPQAAAVTQDGKAGKVDKASKEQKG